MAKADGPEATYALPEGFAPGDRFITVDPGYPCCIDVPNQTVSRGASIHWRSLSGDEFEIRFPGGAPCQNWSSDWRESKNGKLACTVPENAHPGGYKYDVRIGNCECDPIIWVE